MSSKPFAVIGGGFSGLVTAYSLSRAGHAVDLYEKSSRMGGLIESRQTELGLVETAANGLLNSYHLEQLCKELQLHKSYPTDKSRARYIFRSSPQRWPLSFLESQKLFFRFLSYRLQKNKYKPQARETLAHWARRSLTDPALAYLLVPALQGIYAGDPEKLSASLILNSFLSGKGQKRPQKKGLVSFQWGMQELLVKLEKKIIQMGVQINLDSPVHQLFQDRTNVICTDANTAGHLLGSQELLDIEMLPLATVTHFFEKHPKNLKGFGCLFPPSENFNSLGVLFNECIFSNRSKNRSETWILGGATRREVERWSDDELVKKSLDDRARLPGSEGKPLKSFVKLWPKALPHYTVELEQQLKYLKRPPNVYLNGNYLGRIGLSYMIERAQEIAKEVSL